LDLPPPPVAGGAGAGARAGAGAGTGAGGITGGAGPDGSNTGAVAGSFSLRKSKMAEKKIKHNLFHLIHFAYLASIPLCSIRENFVVYEEDPFGSGICSELRQNIHRCQFSFLSA